MPETSMTFAEQFAERFIDQYTNMFKLWSKTGFYNPIYANNAMKQFNPYSNRPTEENIIRWLNNPKYYEQELKGCSEFLYHASQYYNRTIGYVSNILNLDYELICINPPNDMSAKTIDLYKRQKIKNNDWLRKFRVKEQFSNVLLEVARSGGKYYYLRESDTSSYLQGMPDDYCYINGRTDQTGFTYAMNMSFFYQFPESIYGFAPEFASWYDEFLDKNKLLNGKANPYRIMPIDNAVTFVFDDTRPEIIPPFAGVFKDAIEIEKYQDLLRLRAELDTYQILYLRCPTDQNGKPTMSSQEIINYMAVVQTLIPQGIAAVSTPMEMSDSKFSSAQTMNNIIGLGAAAYYQSAGMTPALFGGETKSAVGIQSSIQADYLMFQHMYDQFERFLNYQLLKIEGKFNFAVKFLRRSNYKLDEDKKESITLLDRGFPVSRVMSAHGYEPWEHESALIDNKISELTNLLIPPQTAFTMSSSGGDKGGRPTSEESGKQMTDSNDATRSGEYNIGKFSTYVKVNCIYCNKELGLDNISNVFCNEDCQFEYASR